MNSVVSQQPLTTAVLFIVFNRPDTTAQVFEAIRKARPTRLYVAGDGARSGRVDEAARVADVRRIVTELDWPCELHTLFRDENLGCRRAVSGAISWFFENEPEGIILEDDCLPHPDFFPWCSSMLERYRDEPQVMCVTGNNFQLDMTGWTPSYYYSIYNHCWGWASWRRAWAKYDAELSSFEPTAARRMLSRLSRVSGFAQSWMNSFESVRRGSVDTWDYVWTWSCWLHGGLTCTPRVNLVSNIGFGPDATHTSNERDAAANLPVDPLPPPYTAPPAIEPEVYFDDYVAMSHFGIYYPSLSARVLRKSKNLIKRVFPVRLTREN